MPLRGMGILGQWGPTITITMTDGKKAEDYIGGQNAVD